jgi:hypothetical protein
MVGLMFNELRRGVIVRFADIGEIADHHCLNFPTKKIDGPWNIGHHSFSDNDTSKCIVDIYSLILMM